MAKKHGKKYQEVVKLIDKNKKYSLDEALELLPKLSYTKFPASVEIHVVTSANPKYNDQNIRSTTVLPHGTGKTKKVAAFVSDEDIEKAKQAGADIIGNQDLLQKIQDGKIEFDVLVTTPPMMRDLAKVAKILWPKWLMPSPKAGTVNTKIEETIKEIKKWRIEFKLDKGGIIHVVVGKISFKPEQLKENIISLIEAINASKPSWVKWKLIKSVYLAPTMGPSIQISI